MPILPGLASRFKPPALHAPFGYLFAASASLGTLYLLSALRNRSLSTAAATNDTVSPHLADEDDASLPYPPNPLPGRRNVDSPLGSTRVYEWGPEDGPKTLLVHGISTPSIALADLAHRLVAKGCRVMLFDLFSRGYSTGPSPRTHRHDSSLYALQILTVLASSTLPWTSFTLIGYSLGGALAADFTSYYPHLVEGLVLVAPGGLIRTEHITWKSRLLYSDSGIIPEWVIEKLVARRLWTGPAIARSIEPEGDAAAAAAVEDEGVSELKGGLRSSAVYLSSDHNLLPGYVNSSAGQVVDWQIKHRPDFVPAFISAIRYAPIHGQQPRWKVIQRNIEAGVGKLGKVGMVLGETDPIIVAGEVREDVEVVLGRDNLEVKVVKGVGHDVAISRADEVVHMVEELGLTKR